MKETVLIAAVRWVFKNFGVEEGISELGSDVLKSCVFLPFKNMLLNKKMTREQSEKFLDVIAERPAENADEPYRDMERIYEELTGKDMPQDLWMQMIDCFKENSEQLKKMQSCAANNSASQLNIKNQYNTGEHVTTVAGNQIINYN